jgi:hypothetical protein
MSFRWWAKRDRSSRTRPSWRPTPKWVSAGCTEVGRGGCLLRESQGVDLRGTELRDGQLSLGNGRAQERRAVHEAARAVAKDIALPRAVAPVNRQGWHPHQQTDPKVSGGSPGAHSLASAALMEPRELPCGADLVGLARGGKPQPQLQGVGRFGAVCRRLSTREAAFQIETGKGLRSPGKVAALRSASVHLSRGAI